MIKKLAKSMLVAQIFSVLAASLCLIIDSIVIGRFLGVDGMAAYGLANPILLIIGGIGSILSAGVQVSCSKSIGKGLAEETNRGYSSAVGISAALSIFFLLFVIIFQNFVPAMMGAGTSGKLFEDTRGYLIGFTIGAPGCMCSLVLIPFLQMAGKSGLLIAAVLGMTFADIALDLLNALVFHWGLFGMGLASALSYYVAMAIGIGYFLSKKSAFKFSFKNVKGYKIAELFKSALPSVFNIGTGVLLVFFVNKILMGVNGSMAVAAYTVINTLANASNCVSTGLYGVTLTLSGILFQEEDRTGLKTLLKVYLPRCVVLGLAVALILIFAAPQLVGLFITDAGPSYEMAITGLRIFALGLIPCCFNNLFKGYMQGTERIKFIIVFATIEGVLFPTLAALLLSIPLGVTGVWFFSIAGESMALLCLCFYMWKKHHGISFSLDTFMDLGSDFGVTAENLLETDIVDIQDVTNVAEAAERFCIAKGGDKKLASRVALCIEEMASNVVTHGFSEKRKNHLSVRIQNKGNRWVLRFRDDCRAFDPVNYIPHDEDGVSGIKLMLGMADEARYTYSLNLNNLTLSINSGSSPD